MIIIEERKAAKLPEVSSLFMTMNFYNKALFDVLVQMQESIYNDKIREFEFPLNRLCFLVDMLTKYDDVSFKPLKESIDKDTNTCSGARFKVKPFKHQVEGINFGLNHDKWLLLDDQGLGKTLQMIYLAQVLKNQGKISHCFIICGVNSLKYNWAKEIEKYSNLDYTILGQKVSKTGRVSISSVSERISKLKSGCKEFFIITNAETLQNSKFAEAFNKSKSSYGMIVVDEIHRMKNPQSQSAKTLMKLKADYKVGLTGTVILNVPENAYIPLKFTENIGSTYTQFKNMFSVYGGFGGVQVIGHKNLELLQDLLSTVGLRRLKSEVLDLPKKTYVTEYVEMKKEQDQLYRLVEQGIASELDKLDHKPTIMEEITINMRLRQITAYPGIVSTDTEQSAKMDRLVELIDDIVAQGDKVVVFNTFKGAAYKEYEMLSHYNPLIGTGDQSDAEISNSVSKFQSDDDNKVFVCTWQKMGTGVTLTKASYIIFVDTPWTDGDFQQASDRIYRIGQSKPVTIITLITKGTYDERVQEILNHKEALSGYLLDSRESDDLQIFK